MPPCLRLVRLCAVLASSLPLVGLADELPPPTPSALESTPAGWIDLLIDPALGDWERAPLPSGKPLAATSPWSVDPSGPVLRCEATGIHEMLLHRTPRGDGVFHVEWRYLGAPPKPNSGVFVRTSPDNAFWFQAQLAPTGLGLIFGASPGPAEKPKRHSAGGRHPEFQRSPGEWNVLELTCRGPAVTLWLNGRVVATLADCPVSEGRLGLEAEFNPIEFRQLKFLPLHL